MSTARKTWDERKEQWWGDRCRIEVTKLECLVRSSADNRRHIVKIFESGRWNSEGVLIAFCSLNLGIVAGSRRRYLKNPAVRNVCPLCLTLLAAARWGGDKGEDTRMHKYIRVNKI